MFMEIDSSSSTPVYVQILEQVKHAVASGLLIEGDKLPSIRALARELRVNPNTIIRAYRELEVEGVVISKRGQGSFVTKLQNTLTDEGKCEMLVKIVDKMLIEAYHLQLKEDKVLNLVKERMNNFKHRKDKEA